MPQVRVQTEDNVRRLQFPGRHEDIIEISPGDLGKKYRFLEGYENGCNRFIKKAHARKMDSGWKDIQVKTWVHLVLSPCKTFYYILDGQHRLWFACMVLGKKTFLQALIWDSVDVMPGPKRNRVPIYIQGLNGTSKNFSAADHLHNFKKLSDWPDIFEQMGVAIGFEKSKLKWVSLIRAYALYKRAITPRVVRGVTLEPKINKGSSNLDEMLEIWLKEPPKNIKWVAEAARWWSVLAEKATEALSLTGSPFNSLWGYAPLQLALLIYLQNEPCVLEHSRLIPQAQSSRLLQLKGLSQSKIEEIAKVLLQTLNYKKVTKLISIFGETGR